MSTIESPLAPASLFTRDVSLRQLDDDIYRPLESFPTARWWLAITITGALATLFPIAAGITVVKGIGTWGNNNPVGWGWAIVNFVFWIGIGHAGTLISAILFLLRQRWRTGIARAAEAMTVFAVFCAMQFPLLHTGRPWLAMFWLIPYPNDQAIYQNFRSPLEWDVFAVSTYGLVSVMFWYTGLIPDLASARDRATNGWRKLIYGIASLGWRGSARAWGHYEKAYLLFAGLSTPLVLSVHSIVSFDFAVSVMPGWHTTIFPPYFVAGAVFSGFAMVATIIIIMRKMFRLQHLITDNHLELMNKIVIATSLIVGYAYAMELFTAWYSGMAYERYCFMNRAFGPYAWAYWTMVSCNVFVPQLLWFKKIRRSALLMYPIVILINVGMWFERFVIVVTSLHRDYLPSSWDYFRPTMIDVGLLLGSFGIFLTFVLLFCRFLPTIAASELKAVAPAPSPHTEGTMTEQPSKTVGVVGLYDDSNALIHAAEKIRDAGYKRWDCHTPYPVHGLEDAMGQKESVIPIVGLTAGFIGLAAAILLTGGLSVWQYPIRIGGKALFSWQAFVPIYFELFVLFAALATMASVIGFCRLFRWHSPLHDSDVMKEVTCDRFAIVLEAADKQYNEATAKALLEQTGCSDIRPLIEFEEDGEIL